VLDDPAVRARVDAAGRDALAQAFLDKQLGDSSSDAELHKLYDAHKDSLSKRRVNVAQIFVRKDRPDARDRAGKLRARAAGGEPFDALARAESDDRGSGDRGGDLGSLVEGQVDPKFFAAAAALKAGDVGVVETAFGLHVIKALEAPSVTTPTFEEARGRLAAEQRVSGEARVLEELRKSIGVTIQR
jgi:parvulin-like peptidyl-prolyl isomerase